VLVEVTSFSSTLQRSSTLYGGRGDHRGGGAVTDDAAALVEAAERALTRAIGVARAGVRLNEIGRAIPVEVEGAGFFVLPQLGGQESGGPSTSRLLFRTLRPSDETVLNRGIGDHDRTDHLATTSRAGWPGR